MDAQLVMPELEQMKVCYKTALAKAKELGMLRTEAKTYAKAALYEKFPTCKRDGFVTGDSGYAGLWAALGVILNGFYPKGSPSPLVQAQVEDDRTFMAIIREAAETGFVPYGKHIGAFIGNDKASQIVSYISFIKKEGFSCERNAHGWICKRTESELDKRIRLLQEELDALKQLSKK